MNHLRIWTFAALLAAGSAEESAAQVGPPMPPPAQVTGVVEVEDGEEKLIVSWIAVADADGYVVQWKSGDEDYDPAREAGVAGRARTRYTIENLTPGVEYTVQVFATRTYTFGSMENPETNTVRSLTPSTGATGTPYAGAGAGAARDRGLGKVLAAAGRWIAADAVRVIGGRFAAPAAGARPGSGAHALAPADTGSGAAAGYRRGVRSDAPREGGERRPAGDPLVRSGFDVPLGAAGGAGAAGDAPARWRLWARGTAGGFDGRPEAGLRLDGEVAGGYLGLDRRLPGGALAGVAIAHDRSGVDYTIDPATTGEVDLELTSVLPYAHFDARPDLGVWGLLGAGWGRAELKDRAGEVKTDVTMRMAAAGLRREVAAWRGVDTAAEVDGFLAELEADAAAGLPKTTGAARQLRLRLEGRWQVETSPAARMTPSLEASGRWDGGDAGKGLGMEVGGGLAYSNTDLGLEVEARGWLLLAHEEKALDEWGGGLTVKLDPGRAGRGPWVTFAPGWRAAGSGGLRTWDGPEAFRAGGGSGGTPDLSPDRLELEAGYGAPAHGGLLTPYAGVSMVGSGMRCYRVGARLDLGGRADLGVEGRRAARAGGSDANEVVIRARIDW